MLKFLRTLVVLILIGSSYQINAQITNSEVIRIKLKPETAKKLENFGAQIKARTSSEAVKTGIENLDNINEQTAAISYSRVFRDGGKYENRRRAFGLHLWYEVRFNNTRNGASISSRVESFNNLEEVQMAEPVYDKSIDIIKGRTLTPVIVDKNSTNQNGESMQYLPNDPRFEEQWHYNNTGQTSGTIDADIDLPEAWNTQKGNSDVIVAIIDGGVDYSHEDLAANMWVNSVEASGSVGVDDDGNGYIDDIYGYNLADGQGDIVAHNHGTHVGGTVAAVSNNGIGVAGVAGGSGTGDGARLMSVQVFSDYTQGGFAESFAYAADNGAVIAQNSWGYTSEGYYEQAVLDGIDYFIANAGYDAGGNPVGPMQGGIVIFAAGNDDSSGQHYPGYYAPTLAVASTNHNDQKSWYSNYGDWVDISSPGGETSVTEQGVLSTLPGNSYGFYQGTSMACPHVSGVAALIVSEFAGTGIVPAQLRARLIETTDDIDALNPTYSGLLGSGRLNAANALLTDDGIPPDAITDLDYSSLRFNEIDLSWTAPADSDNGSATVYEIRYSESLIDEGNFESAPLAGQPAANEAGNSETFLLDGLTQLTTYYVAVRSSDFFGNTSIISNVLSFTTPEPPVIGVDPSSLTSDLFTGSSETQTITISNTGEGDLLVSLSTVNVSGTSINYERAAKNYQIGNLEEKNSFEKHTEVYGPIQSDLADLTGIGIAVYDATYYTMLINDIESRGASTVYLTSPISASDLDNVDVIVIDDIIEIIGVSDIDIIRTWINNGGSLLLTGDNSASMTNINSLLAGTGIEETSLGSFLSATFTDIEPHPTTADVSSLIATQYGSYCTLSGSAEPLVYDDYGRVHVAASTYGAGTIIAAGNEIAADGIINASTDNSLLVNQIIDWLSNISQWFTLPVNSGIIPSGTSEDFEIVMDASGLNGGTYEGLLNINSNDPITPLVEIPVTLNVTGAPNIEVPGTLAFNDVFTGITVKDSLLISNTGTDVLNISDVSNLNTDFVVTLDITTLNPDESTYLMVEFTSASSGVSTDQIEITSDDPDEPTVIVELSATSIDPPIIGVTPSSIAEDLYTGETSSQTLTIENNGSSDLTYNITAQDISTTSSLKKQEVTIIPTGPTLNESNPTNAELLASEYTGDYVKFGLTDYGEIMPFQYTVGNEHLAIGSWISGYTVVYNLSGTDHVFYAGYDTRSGIVPVSYTEMVNDANLVEVEVVTQTSDAAIQITRHFVFNKNSKSIKVNTIVENISGSTLGSVVFKTFADWDVDGTTGDDNWNIDESRNMVYAYDNVYTSIATKEVPDFADMDGWSDYNRRLTDENVKGEVLGFDGFEILHYELGDILAGQNQQVNTAFASGDNLEELQFEVDKAIALNWLAVSPISGTISPSSSEDIELLFDASNLYGGTYEAEVSINSNDPVTPSVTVPVTLNVTGAPDIDIANSLDFGELYIGATVLDSLLVSNTGTDVLTISGISNSNTDFSLTLDEYILDPNEATYLKVEFSPSSSGDITDQIEISSDDPDEPTVLVDLSGSGLEPPVIVVDPTSITSDLYTGETEVKSLTITNSGLSDLIYSIEISENITGSDINQKYNLEEHIPPAKGEQDNRVGNPVLSSEGDDNGGFGYHWIDSSEPAGPAYDWVDITSTGTQLSLGDDSYTQVTLPFDFEFYGDVKNSVYISSNGFLTFSSNGASSLGNTSLPYSNNPNDLIALMWTDLYPGNSVYYLAEADRFIVEYYDVPLYGSGGSYTFQVILYPSGNIKIQYLSLSSSISSYTLGIENAAGDDGMEIAYNTTYIDDGLAILISSGPSFIADVDPVDGVIGAGESETIDITLDASGMFGGTYEADITITSNDPVSPTVTVPLTLNVTGAPNIEVTSTLEFDEIFVGATLIDSVLITNTGTDVLAISGITNSNSNYILSIDDTELDPYDSSYIIVEFAPSIAGDLTDQIEISSNDPDEPTAIVNLTGSAIEPPIMVVDPTSITSDLYTGETEVRSFTITNSGLSDLTYAIETAENVSGSTISQKYNLEEHLPPQKGEQDDRIGNPVLSSEGDDNGGFGYHWIDSSEPTGPTFEWIDITSTGTQLSLGDDGYSQVNLPFEFEFYGETKNTVYISANGFLTFNSSSAGSFGNTPLPYSGNPNDLIALMWADLYPSNNVYYLSESDKFIVQYNNVPFLSLGGSYTFEVILYPSGDIKIQYLSLSNTVSYYTLGIENATGDDGMEIAYNTTYIDNNLAILISSDPSFITSIGPTEGVLSAGESETIDITLDASGLFGGTYEADITITSNDPITPVAVVPLTLNVTGAPNIEVTSALEFDEIFVGATSTDSVLITNSGTDLLSISGISNSNSDFAISISDMELGPYETTYLAVAFSPSSDGTITDQIEVSSNDPNSSTTIIELIGEAAQPPIISTDITELEEYLLVDEESSQIVMISNTGSSTLEVNNIRVSYTNESGGRISNTASRSSIGFYADESRKGISNYDFPELERIEPLDLGDTVNIISTIPDATTGAVVIGQHIYFVSYLTNELLEYNITTQSTSLAFPIHIEAYGLAFDGENFWIGSYTGNVYGYNQSGDQIGSFSCPFSAYPAITWNGYNFIVSSWYDYLGYFYEIDYTGNIVTTYTNNDLAYNFSMVYVPAHESEGGGYWGVDLENDKLNWFDLSNNTLTLLASTNLSTSISNGYSLAHNNQDLLFATWSDGMFVFDDGINEISWLSVDRSSASLPPGTELAINVAFNSQDIEAGIYNASIIMHSNDPITPNYSISASLQICDNSGNSAPVYSNDLNLIGLSLNEDHNFDLSQAFTDSDGDALTYTLDTEWGNIAEMDLDGNSLNIHPIEEGEDVVEIVVNDGNCNTLTVSEIMTIENILGIEDLSNVHQLTNYPNPFSSKTTVSYFVENALPTKTLLGLYDMQGTLVDILVDKKEAHGEKTVTYENSNLHSGVYFLVLQIDGERSFSKLIVK